MLVEELPVRLHVVVADLADKPDIWPRLPKLEVVSSSIVSVMLRLIKTNGLQRAKHSAWLTHAKNGFACQPNPSQLHIV